MKSMPNIIAIIPARGGSKGVPRKNIRKICGKPLIAYSIEAALKTSLIERVIVSTEDKEIADISMDFNAEVPFLRPEDLAMDHSHMGAALEFTVNKLKEDGYFPFIMIVLVPTSPFRSIKLLDFLVSKMIEGFSVIETVKRVSHNNLSLLVRNGSDHFIPLLDTNSDNGNRYNKFFYRPYGVFSGTNFYSSIHKPYMYVVKNPICLVDLDTMADFFLAEEIIKQDIFDFAAG